jgi:hypothetical protein
LIFQIIAINTLVRKSICIAWTVLLKYLWEVTAQQSLANHNCGGMKKALCETGD